MRVELSSRALKEGPLGGIGDGGARRVVGLRRVGIAAGPGPVAAQALADDSLALGDKRPVPARPVLVGQQDQVAVWRRVLAASLVRFSRVVRVPKSDDPTARASRTISGCGLAERAALEGLRSPRQIGCVVQAAAGD